jgi:hypothetical protein
VAITLWVAGYLVVGVLAFAPPPVRLAGLLLYGVLFAFGECAYSCSYHPWLISKVPDAELMRANALSNSMMGIGLFFGPSIGVGRLGLEPGQDPQGLRVALEATAGVSELVECPLAVVAEGRVPDVVGQGCGLHDVGVTPERLGEVARHLGNLEGVGQPVADEVVGPRVDHLSLRGQATQGGGVHEAGAVTLERRPLGALGRLVHPAGARCLVVPALRRPHRLCRLLRSADIPLRPAQHGRELGQ